MKIEIYRRFKKEVECIDIDLPSNALVTKLHWLKYGFPLKSCRQEGKNDYDDSEMVHDYYVFLPDVTKDDDVFDVLKDDRNIDEIGDIVLFSNGLLLRLYSCEILDDVEYVSLDELNGAVDFSDRYYKYVRECPFTHEMSVEFSELMKRSAELGEDELEKRLKNMKDSRLKTLSCFRMLRLRDEGVYVKQLGITKDYSDDSDDTVEHYDLPVSNFSIKRDTTGERRMWFMGSSYKEVFETRLNEIVNI